MPTCWKIVSVRSLIWYIDTGEQMMQTANSVFQYKSDAILCSSTKLKCISSRLSAFHEIFLDRCIQLDKYEIELLYQSLNHGTAILNTPAQLDLYMALYAEWHWLKLAQAFDALNISISRANLLTVYDWGCGQGVGTLGLLDSFERRGLRVPIERIVLIEPSGIASDRAVNSIKNLFPQLTKNIRVQVVNKSFTDITPAEIATSENALHIFSNVIDVTGYCIVGFAGLIKLMHRRRSGYVCVSPLNYSSTARMSIFCRLMMPESGFVPLQQCDTAIEAEVYNFFGHYRGRRNITRCQRIFARYSI